MTKRTVFFVVTAVALFTLYAVKFTDWFKHKSIRISYRGTPANFTRNQPGLPVTFLLDREYRLTSIKVYTSEEFKSKKYPRPIWSLVAETNSIPTSDFQYGGNIKGMKPSTPKAVPEPLQAEATYKIVIDAGKKLHGEREFKSRGTGSAE